METGNKRTQGGKGDTGNWKSLSANTERRSDRKTMDQRDRDRMGDIEESEQRKEQADGEIWKKVCVQAIVTGENFGNGNRKETEIPNRRRRTGTRKRKGPDSTRCLRICRRYTTTNRKRHTWANVRKDRTLRHISRDKRTQDSMGQCETIES